jgi:hypothetical protein
MVRLFRRRPAPSRSTHACEFRTRSKYSSGVERQITKATTLAANYIGTVFVSSFRSRDINAPLAPYYSVRPDLAIGQIREMESAGRGISNALEVTLRGNITRYFSGMAQYTLSKALNNTG